MTPPCGQTTPQRARQDGGNACLFSFTHRCTRSVRSVIAQSIGTRDNAHKVMKVRVSLLVVAWLAVWSVGLASAQKKSDSISSKILEFENKWNAAYQRGDVAAMESLLADDFIITVEDGSTLSKSGYIARIGDSSVRVASSEMSDLKVRTHGNAAAVVTGGYHEKGLSKGKPYEYRDRFTDVWLNMNGKWQVIASHYSIPAKE